MKIHVRNEEGNLVPLEIVTLKGEKGAPGSKGEDGVTPNISIGTVTTLEAGEKATVTREGTNENPIFNFGIPKGESGANSSNSNDASIDDTIIATDKTWSSSKIEDFVLTNDNVIWSTVQGENLSVDYTKEGYLREVEIWGNTVQNEQDLSDIKHLGELYIDDEGRKCYKIEIESKNYKNLIDTNPEMWNPIQSDNNVNTILKTPIKVQPNSEYIFIKMQYVWGYVFQCTANGDVIKKLVGNNTASTKFTTPNNCEYVIIRADLSQGDTVYPHAKQFRLFQGDKDWGYDGYITNRCYYKTTFLLPCQLMKVGNISDRLYWDKNKGRYVVEKKINKNQLVSDKNFVNASEYQNHYICYYDRSRIPNVSGGFLPGLQMISSIASGHGTNTVTDTIGVAWGNNDYRLLVNKSAVGNISEAREYFNSFSPYVYYPLATPRLIDTDTREELKLPTFINNTYITVNEGIQGSIKAKAPVDGGKVIAVLEDKNTELETINNIQDEMINTTLLATDEILSVLEPLLIDLLTNEKSYSKIAEMYAAMVKRGLKKEEDIPERYKEQVKEILNNSNSK